MYAMNWMSEYINIIIIIITLIILYWSICMDKWKDMNKRRRWYTHTLKEVLQLRLKILAVSSKWAGKKIRGE